MTAFHLTAGHIVAGRYRVIRPLAEGGMGVIYIAEHRLLGRQVALKLLRREFGQQPALVERFLREARTASAIHSPHTVEILDGGVDGNDGGGVFYVMELLDGEDLGQLLRQHGPLPWRRVRRILGQLCVALAAVHDRGIIHRDLKPANILRLGRSGPDDDEIKLLDFGIAKSVLSDHTLTAVGELVGTPAYMAPEQILGETVDHRADIYAAGVLAYQLLTGHLPFRREHARELLAAIITATPPPMALTAPLSDIPEEAQAIVSRAMHRDPAGRFPDARAFAAALDVAIPEPVDPPVPLRVEPLALDDLAATRPHLRSPGTPDYSPTLPASGAAPPRRTPLLLAAFAALIAGLLWIAFSPETSPPPPSSSTSTPPEPEPAAPPEPATPPPLQQPAPPPSVEPTPPVTPPVSPAAASPEARSTAPRRAPRTVPGAPELDKARAHAQDAVRSACRKHVAFPTPLRITLELEGKTGTPASVQVMRPDDETSVGECAARTLRKAVRLPAFSQARLAVTWRIDVSS